MNAALSLYPRLLVTDGPSINKKCIFSPFETYSFTRKYSWNPLPIKRRKVQVARSSLGLYPDPEQFDSLANLVSRAPVAVQGFVNRAEGFLYTLADSTIAGDAATETAKKQDGDWLGGITNVLESFLKVLKDGFEAVHVPYAYGFAIILLTILVKAATFPLTKKQVESTMAIQNLQPQIKDIQQTYAGSQEMIQLEIARLYKQAGVNPLAGCLPTLATIPVWIGLYRALSNVANEGLLTEGFFWIPSLAGPTTVAARQNGSGISWLLPFVDGHPPLGWSDTLAYLVLPVLLIVSQYISMQIMQPAQANDPNQKSTQAVLKFLPFIIGYFSLSVPSGLSLYWLTNNILSTGQQVWLKKLGGAKPVVHKDFDVTKSVEKLGGAKTIMHKDFDVTKSVEEPSAPQSQLVADPNKPRPGERFKQLKAEEMRRKKEREDAARQQAEATSKAVDVADSDHLHNTQGAGETQNVKALQANDDTCIEDEAKKKEPMSNSSVEKEALADVYNENGNGATSVNAIQSRNEQSKQRGAA